ncbi:thiamine pyrophosphate-dependent enzyme [Humitalea sp. 24SJ18S-53]|uniref:thiamine pyrophosphate-dependent enzyme n=1 Tax=Humitalea sp. 24SJ18S-53 TaxID=3422307 RepID=UPI003D66BF8C
MTAIMTTAEAIVGSLQRHGVDTVYALPGLQSDPLFDAMHQAGDALRVIHPRHEQAAAYMALGAALATGKPQACAVVPGPGLLNASAALLTAYGMNAPVLALAGQIPQVDIDRAHGHLHEIPDQLGLSRHFTKFAARIRAPHEAPALVDQALHSATSGRQRPVLLECAMDVLARRGAVADGAALPVRHAPIDDDAVLAAAIILGAAKRPLIVLGGGALDAGPEIVALAEMLEAPTVAYRRGQGAMPGTHRLFVPLPIAHRLWAEADVVLAIGTRLHMQQSMWGTDADLKVIRIDIDPEEPDRFRRADATLLGDAAEQCRALLTRLPAQNAARQPCDLSGHRGWLAQRLQGFEPQVGFLKAIRAALPEDGIFVDEVTQIGFASRLVFPVHKPRTYLSPGYQDNLGWGLGAALGAQAAMPGTPVLAIAGDGGFLYQIGELATAVQHKLRVVVVLFDNAMFGNVKRIQQERYGNRIISADLVNPDFGKLADAFGIATWRATTPDALQRAITEAFTQGGPALIHVPCGEMPSPWDMILMPKVRG